MSHNNTTTAEATPIKEAAPFQTGRVLTLAVGHWLHDTYTGFLAPLLPVFITNLSLSKTEAGLLTVFIQGPSLLQPVIGYLADRVNLRYLVILAPSVAAVMMSLLGVAPNYAVMALLLTITGTTSAGFHAVGPAVTGVLSGRRLGRGMSFWMVGGQIGRALAPLIIASAIEILGLQGMPWLMGAGILGSAILYLLLKDVQAQTAGPMDTLPWKEALRVMKPLMLPLLGITIVRLFLTSALTTYLPTFLTEGGTSLLLAGASLSVVQAAGIAGSILGGALSDRLGRRPIFLISQLVTPLMMFAFLAVNGWVRFPFLVVLGLGTMAINPVAMALVQESFPQNRALANGLYLAMAFVLRSLIVVLLGAIGDLFGLRQAFTISAIVPLLGLPLVFLLPK